MKDLDEAFGHLDRADQEREHSVGDAVVELIRAGMCLVAHLRSHPAPPPSPSEECFTCAGLGSFGHGEGGKVRETCPRCHGTGKNAGEGASDEGLADVSVCFEGNMQRSATLKERVALLFGYRAGKKHQASADAATIAGLRRVVDAACTLAEKAQPVTRSGRQKPSTDDLADVDLDPLCEAVDALPASLRPEPGGGK